MPPLEPFDLIPSPDWEPCSPGEIARLGQKLRKRAARRRFLHTGAATIASLLAVGGSLWLARSPRKHEECDYGGITCSQIAPVAKAYLAGNVAEPTRSKIAAHIACCPHCGPVFKAVREKLNHT